MKTKKNNILLTAFIIINIIFIFLQIHKQTYIVKYYYEKQRLDKEKDQLLSKKNYMEQKMYELKKQENVYEYANKKLGMQKIKLNQIKKVDLHEPNL